MLSETRPVEAERTESASPTPQDTTRNEFVVALFSELQRGRYSLCAWWRFVADACIKSWQTAREHPKLTRSWLRVSAVVALVGLAGFGAIWLIEGQAIALSVLPMLALCLAVQQADVWVHLGLNRAPDGQLREQLGLPTTLTLVRGVMAGILVAHLLRGLLPATGLALSVYLLGIATDIADGQVARCTGWLARLGGNLDGEADLFLYSSATLCALLGGLLPGWFVVLMLGRFGVLVVGGLLSYFVVIRQVDFSHTAWGRFAALGQALCLIVAFAPGALAHFLAPAFLPLLAVTAALAALAPLMEIRKNLRYWRLQEEGAGT